MADESANDRKTPTEAQARTILESVTDAFFLLDRAYRFAYLNGTAKKLLQRDDLVGKSIWEEFPAAKSARFGEAYEQAMQGTKVDFVEYYPAPLDRWYDVRAYPAPEGISVYFQDITERRRAEAAYEQSRAQLELVVRGADVGVWYCPLPFDELIWDEKVKEHFHLPPSAHVTIDTFYERLHPEDRERTRAAIDISVNEKRHYDIDYRTVSPDGQQTKWIRAIGRAFYGDDGAPIRFDGVTIDVSRRKLAELALSEREERYRLATRATNDVIWDWDLATNHVRWNESFTTLLGYEERDTTAAFWVEHIHPDDRERIGLSIHHVIDDAKSDHWQSEYRFRRSDGTWLDFMDRGYVLRDAAGRGIRMIGAMQDRTEQKRSERERERVLAAERAARSEAERESRVKDEFLATLSHELRTPLNAMLGWSQLALKRSLDAEQRRALEIIARNAKAQARIVDDLLDMSRMLAGKIQLDLSRLALGALVEASMDTARPMAQAKGVSLVSHVSSVGDAIVIGDPSRLQQVMWNLIANAIKFTPAGGSVEVAVERDAASTRVLVKDDGEGIAPDFLPHVFDRFRQADGSTTRRHGGLGLGLSIVKQVVELHGGTVRAASAGVGLGSVFTVELPRASPTSGRPETVSAAPPAADGFDVDLRGLRVLVVDDEPDARSLVCRILEDRGADVMMVSGGVEAVAALRSGPFDVLVSDLGMPEEDGYSLLRRIRALSPAENCGIPAIAVTALARAEDRVRALTAGFHFHIAKPLDAAELAATVAAAGGRFG